MIFYPKLALTNIQKNKKIFIPYILTSIFAIAMYYIVSSLSYNKGLENHETISTFMSMGQYVIIIFAAIFLFYANSFIIKRRKREISLYNILGMEKRHIMIMMFFETCMISVVSIMIGLIVGILFSQLMYLILINMMHMTNEFVFNVPFQSIILTILIFIVIFFLSLIFDLVQVKLSNPIELMRGSNTGEKEPKTKVLMTIIGIVSLSAGYYIALSIDDPLSAITLFFVAVILVIIGTYALFTAGSIAILKALKKNKYYYYQTRHFTSISGMIYRMKQNAVGLSNICILCTCVLVTLSSTFCLYNGIEVSVEKMSPVDQMISTADQNGTKIYQITREMILKNHLSVNDYFELETFETEGTLQDSKLIFKTELNNYSNITSVNFITLKDYNKLFNKKETLQSHEVLIYSSFDLKSNDFYVEDMKFKVKGTFNDPRVMTMNSYGFKSAGIVVEDQSVINKINKNCQEANLLNYKNVGFNCEDNKKVKEVVNEVIKKYGEINDGRALGYRTENKADTLEMHYDIYGGLLFIGVFLSAMFLIGAILIIYYKQLTEGYEDQKRFEILQNVGMSQKEVKQTIRSQVLIFFFLPLVVSVIHLSVAYSLIFNILQGLLMAAANTYILSCAICILGLVIIYSIVYTLTARTYYQIVKK